MLQKDFKKVMWRRRRVFKMFPMQEENVCIGKTAQMGLEMTLFTTVGMKSIPVWVFSLIYSYTTPSQSAQFCDTPRVTASSPPPQTQRTCRRGRYPGARSGRPGSGSQRPPQGSHEWLEGARPAPRLRRLPKEVPHERSCPLGRGC